MEIKHLHANISCNEFYLRIITSDKREIVHKISEKFAIALMEYMKISDESMNHNIFYVPIK